MMPIAILFILAGSIIFIFRVRQNEYRPKPIQYVSNRDFTHDHDWCPIHKMHFGHMGVTCPSCERDYHNDIFAGIYPPGIDDSMKQFYYVEDWIELRKIDLMWKNDQITEQEAISRKNVYIRNTIPKRIAVATGTAPDIQRAKIEANQKRLCNYAGAAQYSGITPK